MNKDAVLYLRHMARFGRSALEVVFRYRTREQARNAALRWLETRGGPWGGEREVMLGKGMGGSLLKGKEVGVETTDGTHRHIRLDWDPEKGPHYNTTAGRKGDREKAAFCFEAPEGITPEFEEAWVAKFRDNKPRIDPSKE